MPFEVFMGLRYLRARGQRTNLSLFVWIGVGGVFLGVAALIVVLATMTGFQEGIRDRIIAANPHLLVYRTGRPGLADAGTVAARITEVPGVRSATPFVHQQALFTRSGGGAHGGLIRGIDLTAPAVLEDVTRQLRSGSIRPVADGEAGILLGRELARTLGVMVGDEVTVISPEGALTAVGMVPRMRRYPVAGTLAGSALGLGLIWAQTTYTIITLASDVYQISYLPMKLTLGDGLMVIGATLFLSFLATIIPARRAGALEPVDVLRYE